MKTDKHFISYSRVDASDLALKLAADLKANGFNVWIDQQDIAAGTVWDIEVQKALNTADSIIIILSKASVNSANVLDEVSYALKQKKHIYPILKDDCDIPFRLDRIQRIDFRNNYDSALKKLIDALDETPPTSTTSSIAEAPGKWKRIIPFLLGAIVLLIAILYIVNKKRQNNIHGYVTEPVKNKDSVKSASPNTNNPTLFYSVDYKGQYKIENDNLILTVYSADGVPAIYVDVNQNKMVDPQLDRAYGIRSGTLNALCPSFFSSATGMTPCDGAPSNGKLKLLHKEYTFTIPLEEIKGNAKAESVSFQVSIYSGETGWHYFPAATTVDFTHVFIVGLNK